MNYYERHLGDYARDTGHLSLLEHGVYTLLLDRYYATEAGIPDAQAHRLARARTEEEREAVNVVLEEFFVLEDGIWRNARAEEEIEKAKARIHAAHENGKKGGRPRKQETQEKPSGFSVGSFSETQTKAHQAPSTRHQTPAVEAAASNQPSPARDEPAAAGRDPVTSRALELTALLRQRGAAVQPGNPHVRRWAESGVTDAQALTALETADRRREETRSANPVNAGLLNAILADVQATERSPPRRRSIHDERAETIANLTGRSRNHDRPEQYGNTIDITPAVAAGVG